MSKEINIIFPTSIFCKDNILLNELENYEKDILNYFEINKTKKMFFESSLTNNSYFNTENIFNKTIYKNLKNEILNNCKYFSKELGFSDKQICNYGIQNIWANLIKKNDYHHFHHHAGCNSALISGVFYVTSPDSAKLSFQNIYTNSYTPEFPDSPNYLTTCTWDYNCLPGRMIIFRSHTLHGYTPHLDDKNKISIAFNFGK